MSDVTPYLCVADARAAIDWYTKVFGARLAYEPIVMADGRVGHVELTVGDSVVMMADSFPEVNVEPPDPARGNAVSLHVRVPECDTVAAAAVAAGALLDRGPESSEHGRVAVFRDPFGHRWMVNTDT